MNGWRVQLRPLVAAPLAGAALLIALVAGCQKSARERQADHRGPVAQSDARDALFDSVVENLDHLEQFDVNEMMPQICDRLNQWYQQDKPNVAWQEDPLVAKLPDQLRSLRVMKTLDLMQYRLPDAWHLQESVWLRDISRAARADQFEDLAVAERLFDWTVRNIQLEPDGDPAAPGYRRRPFESLLFGRGQADERAWIFMLLARQQGLDVVLLGLGDAEGNNVRPWLTALASGGKLYLFDCRLGLPVPGPGGKGVATLEEVVADEQLLRQLDLDAEHPYPVKAADLAHVVALVEASPLSLSRRMALVESRLAGKYKMVVTSPASAVAERVKSLPHVSGVQLWQLPFEIWQRQSQLTTDELQAAARELVVFQAIPPLMVGRALYFKRQFDGEEGAKSKLMSARPSDDTIDNFRLPRDVSQRVGRENVAMEEARRIVVMRHAKQHASFWLGLICFEEQDYPVAVDYFSKRTLEATPDGPWTPAARYNLARTYEAMGDLPQAIALYEADDSPQSHGNRLRARRLREQADKAAAK